MRVRPVRLNATMAWLFVVGSALFVLGSVPAYVNAVGGTADSVTYFVGSVFFTCASYTQLVQAQSPAMLPGPGLADDQPAPARLRGWLPHDRGWQAAATQFPGTLFFNISTFAALARNATAQQQDRHVWRPDVFGSTLFLVASVLGILALGGGFWTVRARSLPWWIAWINLLGSVLFMASALASYLVPTTDDFINSRLSVAGTLWGAVCFLIGAALLLPAWRRAVADVVVDRA